MSLPFELRESDLKGNCQRLNRMLELIYSHATGAVSNPGAAAGRSSVVVVGGGGGGGGGGPTPPILASVSAVEQADSRYQDSAGVVYETVQVTITLANAGTLPWPITIWMDHADGNGWTWEGTWNLLNVGQTINVEVAIPVDPTQTGWKVGAIAGAIGISDALPAGFVFSLFTVTAATACPPTDITDIAFQTNPTNGTLLNYSQPISPGVALFSIYELDWTQPTLQTDSSYWGSFATVQKGYVAVGTCDVSGGVNLTSENTGVLAFQSWMVGYEVHVNGVLSFIATFVDATHVTLTIAVPNGAGQGTEVFLPAPDFEGTDEDSDQIYRGRMFADSNTIQGGTSIPNTTVQIRGNIPPDWGVPLAKNSDGSTNLNRTYRFRVYAMSVLAQNERGATGAITLQTGWASNADHFDITPANPDAIVDLTLANPNSLGNGVGQDAQKRLMNRVLGGLSFDTNGNTQANLGYTMRINSNNQIVLGNLPSVWGLPALPSPDYPAGAVILNTVDYKIYRNPSGVAWVKSSDPADLVAGAVATGVTVSANQVTAGELISGVQVTGTIYVDQLNVRNNAKIPAAYIQSLSVDQITGWSGAIIAITGDLRWSWNGGFVDVGPGVNGISAPLVQASTITANGALSAGGNCSVHKLFVANVLIVNEFGQLIAPSGLPGTSGNALQWYLPSTGETVAMRWAAPGDPHSLDISGGIIPTIRG